MYDGARTRSPVLTDGAAFLLSLLLGALVFSGSLDGAAQRVPQWQETLDISLGLVACALLWSRQRLVTALLIMPLTAISALSQIAGLVAVFTVAVHRRTSVALAVAAGYLAAAEAFAGWRPQRDTLLAQTIEAAVCLAVALVWGMAVQARRRLVTNLRDRAAQATIAERTRIARDMHDVLAHRISLVALHAGALKMRPDVPAERVRESAELLRTTARQALEELRDVIGVLRGSDGGQPTLRDIARLVDESRAAGATIDLVMTVADCGAVPNLLGRDAYRIVQESLTNVAKHAPDTAARVRIDGAPGGGLTVSVHNQMPRSTPGLPDPGPPQPSAGAGLIGLRERVTLAGGTIAHGIDDLGEFVLEANLPWP